MLTPLCSVSMKIKEAEAGCLSAGRFDDDAGRMSEQCCAVHIHLRIFAFIPPEV